MFRTNLDEGRPSRFVGLFESPAPPDGDERPDWGFSIFQIPTKKEERILKNQSENKKQNWKSLIS